MTQDAEMHPWPKWVRYSLLVVLGVVGGIAIIVALYDKGVLPIAGIFVAMLVGPAILFFKRLWFAARLQRLLDSARRELTSLAEALQAERALSVSSRSSGASDDSLARARLLVGESRDRLERDPAAALGGVERLLGEARLEWSPQSPLTEQVERAAGTVRQLHERTSRLASVR